MMPWNHRSDDMRDPPWGYRRFEYRPPSEPSMSCGAMVLRMIFWALVVLGIVWCLRRF